MRIIRSFIFNTLIYVALVALLLFGLPKFLSWALETPYPMAAITSGSMWPELKEGDLVLVRGVSKEGLALGDIIIFRSQDSGTFTIHRIVKLNETTLQTQGDANFDPDKPVPYENVVGELLTIRGWNARLPYLGAITVFANNLRQ